MHTAPKQWFYPLFASVVIVQGIHVVEHIIQMIQVYAFGIPDDDALGLLGYVFQFQGTEEWLHLLFNASYLIALYVLFVPLRQLVPAPLPTWAFWVFALGAVGLETWHMVEHGVIISNVIQNGGCPCPGIGDAALGTTDTILHFFYNTIDYAAVLTAFWFVWPARPLRHVRRETRRAGRAAV
jgi:hypothetical protein